jgi:hypothetical protein
VSIWLHGRNFESSLRLWVSRFEEDLNNQLLGRNHLCHDRVMTLKVGRSHENGAVTSQMLAIETQFLSLVSRGRALLEIRLCPRFIRRGLGRILRS